MPFNTLVSVGAVRGTKVLVKWIIIQAALHLVEQRGNPNVKVCAQGHKTGPGGKL